METPATVRALYDALDYLIAVRIGVDSSRYGEYAKTLNADLDAVVECVRLVIAQLEGPTPPTPDVAAVTDAIDGVADFSVLLRSP